MSRQGFRANVVDRPASAWVLVIVASTLLWITEQLQPWVIAVEATAIVASLARRRKPFAWQSSPVWLNVGMFGIAGTTIAIALDGSPSVVSLAHFATLTQGLQLLDARPRKSEFLLVTLALFQVILASNLTDSLLFPPLLAVFVVCAVWTLMVHTLRSEAIEAHDRAAANRAITPGLRRMTLIASTCSILLGLVLFMFLPRMRTSMLQSGMRPGASIAGFSDRVELGAIGRIRKDRTIVLRVETLEGTPPAVQDAYWRGLAFDRFDGTRWAITPSERLPQPGSIKFGISIGPGPSEATLVQRVVREPVEGGVLFGAGLPRYVSGALMRLESDLNGGLYDPLQTDQRIRYTIETDARTFGDPLLRADRAGEPPRLGRRYLELADFDPAIQRLAESITLGAGTDADRARAIELYLRRNGRYTDNPPPLGTTLDHSPIEDFLLGDLAGHCEYFASSMVVLARSVGLPSRLVNGFAGGRMNPLGGFVELARSDAHAWVEVHYRNAGWVRYDPTPPDLRLGEPAGLSFTEHLTAFGSMLELWWFQRVVDFDSSDQIRAVRTALDAWKRFRTAVPASGVEHPGLLSRWRTEDALLGRSILGGLVAATLLSVIVVRRRQAREGLELPQAYARALTLLSRRGLIRAPASTARQFSRSVSVATSAEASTAFAAITEAYLAQRFGGRAGSPEASEHLLVLQEELRAHRRG